MIEIEVKVTLANIEEIEAEVAKMFEEAQAKILSGEIKPEDLIESDEGDEKESDGTTEK